MMCVLYLYFTVNSSKYALKYKIKNKLKVLSKPKCITYVNDTAGHYKAVDIFTYIVSYI